MGVPSPPSSTSTAPLPPVLAPEENILTQLRLLFAQLACSDMSSVSVKGFCHSLKDYDGRPTDLLTQQDASEFLTKFFQQVSLLLHVLCMRCND